MQLFFFTDLTVIHEMNGKDEREIFFDEDGIIIIIMQKEKKENTRVIHLLEIRLSKNGGRFWTFFLFQFHAIFRDPSRNAHCNCSRGSN